MATQVIPGQAGPLPITATFNAPGDEPMYLEVDRSVWTQIPNEMIAGLPSKVRELGQLVFPNDNFTHRAVVPAYIPIQPSQGQHTPLCPRP